MSKLNDLIRVVAFDFDNTMTKFNVCQKIYEYKMNSYVSDPEVLVRMMLSEYKMEDIFCELFRSRDFLAYLRNVKSTGRVKFVVISFGYKKIIELLLCKYGINDIFSGVYSPIDFGLKDNYNHAKELNGKNVMMKRVMKDFNFKGENNSVMLVDDNIVNIKYAEKGGFSSIHVEGDQGLTKLYRYRIAKFVEGR